MAEENINVDNLDEAASQYNFLRSGTTNFEVPTFEKQQVPQVPQTSIRDAYPKLRSTDNPAYPMRDQVTGLPPYGLNSLPKNNTKNMDFSEAISANVRRKAFNFQDNNVYAKAYSFDSSPQGAHMARYKGYGQETFDRIGFNPELNNEAIFNEQTTMLDDYKRLFTHAAWPMMKLGFMAPLESYQQMITGDTSKDIKNAIDYEEYSAIGYSTKGGVGGFVNNVLNSAAYSAGIIGEAIAEGMLVGAVEGSIVGPEGTAAGGALGGAFGAVKGALAIPKSLWHLGKYGSKMLLNLKNAQKYTAAKEMFKAASTTIGDFINPISNTKEALANNVFGNSDNLSRMARAARTFGGFYNDVKNINAALSEASLEAGFVENNMYKNMYDKYYAENGVAPTSEEQRQMRVQSQLAATWSKGWNTGLIFYSNKITFPTIMKGNIFRNAHQTLARSGAWKAIFDPKKQIYEKVKVGLGSALKGLVRPANYGKMSLAYFKTNVTEGLQENLQDVIADATEKYFTDAYKNDLKRTNDYAMAAFYNGLEKQISAQGLETFASGFAIGAVLRPLNNVPKWLTIGYNRIYKDRDSFTKDQEEKEQSIDDLVNALNLMHTKENGADFINMRSFNYGAMGNIAKVLDSESVTTKEEIDAKQAALSTALITALQTGTYDMFIDNFKGYLQMTPKELEDAWGLEEGQGEKAKNKINEIVEKGKTTTARFNYALKKHKLNINMSNYKKGTPEYQKAKLIKSAHDMSIRNLVFMQDAFDNNLERINSINSTFANLPGFSELPSTYIQALLDPSRLNSEMEMLRTEVAAGGDNIDQKRRILEAFENLQAAEQMFNIEFLSKLKEKYNTTDVSLNDEEVLKEIDAFAQRFVELGIDPENDYKAAFADVLRAISGDDAKFYEFMSKPESADSIEGLFDALLDLNQLKYENKNLVPYINLLLDPDGFAEHVERNYQWMQNLYNERKDYFKEIVNEQVKNVEYNSLLADLADEGIYLDLNEFADFVETGKLPTYFIDSTTEAIIREGSVLYDIYIDKFYMALENRDKNVAGDKSTLEERLEELINERNEQRAKELEDAKLIYQKELKIETGKTEQQLLKLQNIGDDQNEERRKDLQDRINELNSLSERLTTANAQEIADINTRLIELNIYSKDASELAQDLINTDLAAVQESILELVRIHQENNLPIAVDANGNIADEAVTSGGLTRLIAPKEIANRVSQLEKELSKIPETAPVENVIENTKAYKAYQKAITEINDKYDKLIDELKAEYAKKATGTQKPKITVETPWEELPTGLRDKLTPLFEEFKTKNNITPEEEGTVRQNWLKSQALVIDEYNKSVAEGVAAIGVPKLLFLPNDFEGKKLDELKLYELRALRDTAQTYLNTNKKPDPSDPKETLDLTQDDKNNLKADVNSLNEYISSIRATFRSDATLEAKLEIFRERVLDRQDEIEEELDEEGNVIARYLDGKIAQRVTKHAEDIQSKLLGTEKWMFSSVKEEVKPDGTIHTPWTLQYFRSILENDNLTSEQKVSSFMSEFRKKTKKGQFAEESKLVDLENALKKDFSEENLKRTINKLAFREAAIAGNTVDALIRDFFTLDPETGFKKITKPVNMTQNAFDALFGETGIITEFRDGMIDGKFFILSNNLNVFDSNLLETGLAGAMDIIAVDEDGNFFIVDIKTSTESNWEKFDTEYIYKVKPNETIEDIAKKYNTTVEKIREINADDQTFEPGNFIFVAADAKSKKLYFRLQQSIYRNLFYNMTGIMPQRLGLLPIQLEYDLTGFITTAKKASIVPEGESTVDLEYAPEVEDYGVTLIEPQFEEKTPPAVTVTETGEEGKTTVYEQEAPEDTSLGANVGKTVLYRGQVGKLIVTDDGVYGVEIPTPTGSTIIDLYSDTLPAKDKSILASKVGIQFIAEVIEPMQNQVVNDTEYKIEYLDRSKNNVRVNGIIYRVNKNDAGQAVSLTFNTNQSKIQDIDARTTQASIQLNDLINNQKKAKDDGKEDSADRFTSKISKLRSDIQSLNIQRKKLVETDQQRTIRGGNMQDVIFALNSTPQAFNEDATDKTVVDEVRELKQINNLSVSSTAAERIDMILSANYPTELDNLLTQGIGGINAADRSKIIEWAKNTITELENYGFALLAKGDLTTDVENQILALNQLLNDLELIKLKKDGQISKQQPEARKIFQPEKVQTRPSVPKTQEPVGAEPEGVPATKRREKPTKEKQSEVRNTIKQLIKGASDKEIAEGLLGIVPVSKAQKSTKDFIKKINKANSINDLLIIKADAHAMHIKDPASIEINLVDEVFDKKLATFDTDLTVASVKENDYLINKGDKAAQTIYVVVGVNVDKNTVDIKILGEEGVLITLLGDQIKSYERFNDKPEIEIPEKMEEVTDETKSAVDETAQNLEDLEKTPGAFDDVEDQATKSDKKTRFKNLKDNSNNC